VLAQEGRAGLRAVPWPHWLLKVIVCCSARTGTASMARTAVRTAANILTGRVRGENGCTSVGRQPGPSSEFIKSFFPTRASPRQGSRVAPRTNKAETRCG
jgi:hypothetical protein